MAVNNFIELDIVDLHLDPENPRLPERLRNSDEKEVLNWMLSDATLIDLMASISENGFFNGEPILVINENGKHLVVEGNRRLASVKLLDNPELATTSPRTVKTVSDNAKNKGTVPSKIWVYLCKDRIEVQNYLGFRHVSGVKQWPLISKARYLYKLFKEKGRNDYSVYKELAMEIGSKGAYVKKLLTGYQAFLIAQNKGFFGISNLDEENFNLSLISDVITNQSAVADYMGIDADDEKPFEYVKIETFEEVIKWLYQITETGSTRVGDNRNLHLLNKILQNKSAKKAFIEDKKSITEAAELTDLSDENIRYYLQQANGNLIEAQRLLHKAKYPTNGDENLLEEIANSTELISNHIKRIIRVNKINIATNRE